MVDAAHGTRLAQMRRGTLPYCVLAMLADDERYGFDLVKALSEVQGMTISEGTIYPLLARLRREKLIESRWRESTSGPPRRYYRLSEEGRVALEQFIDEWHHFSEAVNGVIAGKAKHERV